MPCFWVHPHAAGSMTAAAVPGSFGLSCQKEPNELLFILLCCFAPLLLPGVETTQRAPPASCPSPCLDNSQHHLPPFTSFRALRFSHFLLCPSLLFCHTFHVSASSVNIFPSIFLNLALPVLLLWCSYHIFLVLRALCGPGNKRKGWEIQCLANVSAPLEVFSCCNSKLSNILNTINLRHKHKLLNICEVFFFLY